MSLFKATALWGIVCYCHLTLPILTDGGDSAAGQWKAWQMLTLVLVCIAEHLETCSAIH